MKHQSSFISLLRMTCCLGYRAGIKYFNINILHFFAAIVICDITIKAWASRTSSDWYHLHQILSAFPSQCPSESNHLCSQTHFLWITWDLCTLNGAPRLRLLPLISRLEFRTWSRLDLPVWWKVLFRIVGVSRESRDGQVTKTGKRAGNQ